LPTTLLVQPRKPESQEIVKPARPDAAANTEGPGTGPWLGAVRIHPRELDPAALCTRQISAIRAQFCTNEECPQAPDLLITPTNRYHLDKIDFDPQNRAKPAPSCAPPQTRRLRPNLEFVFSTPPHPFACIRVHSRPSVFLDPWSRQLAQRFGRNACCGTIRLLRTDGGTRRRTIQPQKHAVVAGARMWILRTATRTRESLRLNGKLGLNDRF
jgi:hypothetical protein